MNILLSLKIISNLSFNDYLSTSNKNIVGKFRNSYVANMVALLYCETYSYTREALRKLYCEDIPKYIDTIKPDMDKLTDLKDNIKNSIDGLCQLKCTYKNAGYLDTEAEFDTIIDSFAMMEMKKISLLLNPKKEEIPKPKLERQHRVNSIPSLTNYFGNMML